MLMVLQTVTKPNLEHKDRTKTTLLLMSQNVCAFCTPYVLELYGSMDFDSMLFYGPSHRYVHLSMFLLVFVYR